MTSRNDSEYYNDVAVGFEYVNEKLVNLSVSPDYVCMLHPAPSARYRHLLNADLYSELPVPQVICHLIIGQYIHLF